MDDNTAKPFKPSRGPINADRFALEVAKAINALLIQPIGVLPAAEGDTVRPFKIGIGRTSRHC